VARKKGPVLYELLQKDRADRRQAQPNPNQPEQVTPPVPAEPQEAPHAEEPAAQPQPVAPPSPQGKTVESDGEGFVLHVTRGQVAVVAGVLVVALLVFFWVGQKTGEQATPKATPTARTDGGAETGTITEAAARNSDRDAPLSMIIPPARSERVEPDSPVLVRRSDAGPAGTGRTARAGPAPRAGNDPRVAGLNYVVIQNVPAGAEASEHAESIRNFLADKGIEAIAVDRDSGGLQILSKEGFDFDRPGEKDRAYRLIDRVERAGKEYAAQKYPGRYNFRGAYPKKYKGE
jgi:hypothetical protein